MTTDNQAQPTRADVIRQIMQTYLNSIKWKDNQWTLQTVIDIYNEHHKTDITADEVEKLMVLI